MRRKIMGCNLKDLFEIKLIFFRSELNVATF